ncbi:hypothetical protein EMCRGX_G033173 [Ephydatia muelleri]
MTAERRAIIAEERAATAEETASVLEKTAAVLKREPLEQKGELLVVKTVKELQRAEPPSEERAKVAEIEVTAAVMKATAADTRANGLEERTNEAEGAVKTLQESARISDIRMAELVQTNSCQLSDFGSSNFARSYGILVLEMACGQFPEVQKRLDVMKRLQWSAMKTLIEQCSARSPGFDSLKIVKKLPGSDKVEGFEEGPCAFTLMTSLALLGRVDQDWLRGRLGGKEGLFPAQFVEIKIDLPPPAIEVPPVSPVVSSSPVVSKAHCLTTTALYDFDRQEGELSFKAPSDTIQTVRGWSKSFQKDAQINREKSWNTLPANGRWLSWKTILELLNVKVKHLKQLTALLQLLGRL